MKDSKLLADFSLSCFSRSLTVKSWSLTRRKNRNQRQPVPSGAHLTACASPGESCPPQAAALQSRPPPSPRQYLAEPEHTYFLTELFRSSSSRSGTSFTSTSMVISWTSFCFLGALIFFSSSVLVAVLSPGLWGVSSSFAASLCSLGSCNRQSLISGEGTSAALETVFQSRD